MLQSHGMKQNMKFLSSEVCIQRMEGEIAELEASKTSLEKELTEYKRTVLSLQSSEKQYRRLFESAKDGILILNADTERIVDVNPFLIDLLGYPYEYFIGKELWEIGVFLDIEASKAASVALQQEGYIRYDDLPLETRDGRRVAVEFVSNVYLVDSARIIQCNIRDITERKNAVETMRLDARRVQTLLDLHLLSHAAKEIIMEFVLESCLSMTQSEHSFIGFTNETETMITLTHCSRSVKAEQGPPGRPTDYPVNMAGLWGDCVRQRKPMHHNGCGELDADKIVLPPGYAPIHRFMAVPVFDGNHIVAVASVANKECDYNDADANALSILFQKMWDILSRQQKEQERKTLEEQYRQAQKMEAVGQLAGGIAHDFNNILQAILGYGSLLMVDIPKHLEAHEFAENIVQGAEQASALTRQLLTFSHRQILEMKDLELGGVVRGLSKMIESLMGENIVMKYEDCDQCFVHADRGQMEQVLLNLCLNARDAMPKGGVISIGAENVVIDKHNHGSHVVAPPGRYVLLSVTDTGAGMDNTTQERIFEPFFTTKGVGKGTGLGLATVYGIVRQHQGLIQVQSALGGGTTFKIYLPKIDNASMADTEWIPENVCSGTETILFAEDEKMLQLLGVRILEDAGYTVLLAANGEEALDRFEKHATDIDLCLLDVVMPKMGGKAVYDILHPQHPNLRFLFTSGYNINAIHKEFVLDEDIELIQKPCTPDELLEKLRQVLDTDLPQSHG